MDTTTQAEIGMTQVPQAGQVQTVVVVQQGASQQATTTRYNRIGFLIFSIAMGAWNFLATLGGMGLSNSLGPSAFLTLTIPGLIVFVMCIVDSTTHCNNAPQTQVVRICCCPFTPGSFSMVIPVGIAAALRFIFWIIVFGELSEGLVSLAELGLLDNVVFFFISMMVFDVGPIVLMTIDFYYYYKKQDYEGIFGHKLKPLRVIICQSLLILIVAWCFMLLFNGIARYVFDELNVFQFVWPWIVHGVVSSIIFLAALWMQYTNQVQGADAINPLMRYLCLGLGVCQSAVILCVAIGMLNILQTLFLVDSGAIIYWLLFMTYYIGQTVPTAIALFSVKMPTAEVPAV